MFSDLKIVTGSSNPELAKAICDHLGCQLTPNHLQRWRAAH